MAEKRQKKLKVVWEPEDLDSYRYANNLAITQAEDEFHLIFGLLVPPNTANMKYEDFPDTASVKPVSCLVVSPKNLEAFIRVLNDYYDKFKESKGESHGS